MPSRTSVAGRHRQIQCPDRDLDSQVACQTRVVRIFATFSGSRDTGTSRARPLRTIWGDRALCTGADVRAASAVTGGALLFSP
jgi:hypothetical protein